MSEFEKLAAHLHDLGARKRKKAPLALLVTQPEEKRNGRADDDVGCLAKALQFAHAAGALTGAEASRLDLIARQGKMPANLRMVLLSLDTASGEKP